MLGSKFAAPAIVLAAILIVAVPATSVVITTLSSDDHDYDLEWVHGTVTAIVYSDCEMDDEDDADDDDDQDYAMDDDEEDEDEDEDGIVKVCAFIIDDNVTVKFGPWWYWLYQSPTITDVVHEGDEVNVTGELKELDDGSYVLEAWHIENITTGEELTIKEEGRPPWAGGPKAYGIDPWPPSDEDD